jgi:hypothetical protein
MKKSPAKPLAAVLALILMLGACGQKAPPAETSAPSATAPAVSARPTLAPFKLDTVGERWYANTTLEVIPRDDYGEVYPFIGGIVYRNYWGGRLFGFATTDGKIICDAAFSDVLDYTIGDDTVYVARRDTGKVIPRPYSYDEDVTAANAAYDCTRSWYLIAGDASYIFGYDEIVNGQHGYFSVRKGDVWGVIDYRGNEILPYEYAYPPYWGDGMFVVEKQTKSGEYEYWYVDEQGNRATQSFPYVKAPYDYDGSLYSLDDFAFSNGRAIWFDGEYDVVDEYTKYPHYGFIDKTGNVVIPAKYVYYGSYNGGHFDEYGYACVIPIGGEWDDGIYIDRDGNEVPAYVQYFAENPEGAELLYQEEISTYNDETSKYDFKTTFYNRKGEVVYAFDKRAYDLGNGWFALIDDSGSSSELWKDGETYCKLNGYFCERLAGWSNPEEDRFVVLSNSYERLQIVDKYGSVLYDIQKYTTPSYYSAYYDTNKDGSLTIHAYAYSESDYDTAYTQTVSPDGDILEPLKPQEPTNYNYTYSLAHYSIQYGDHTAVRDGYYGGLQDKNGEWVVKVSLLDSLPD